MTDEGIARAERRRNYHSLDALRGVAAVAVVAFHYPMLLTPVHFGGAYLAVDLFFLMSGFVIAHAYEGRFAAGLAPGPFLLARICRLYPLFAIGVLISAAGIAAALAGGVTLVWTWGGLATAAAANLAFLPSPPIAGKNPDLYPLNFPAWSLFYELLINLVFALTWRWLRGWRLAAVIAVAGIAIVAVAAMTGKVEGGVDYHSVPAGLARVTFSFFVGVAMLRLMGRRPALRLPVPVILVAATALLLVNVPDGWRGWYDAACVLLLFPLLIWSAVHVEPRRGIAACTFLGLISYPIYMLHIPVQTIVLAVSQKLLGQPSASYAPGLGVAVIAGLITVSWMAARHVDPPLRRALERMVLGARRKGSADGG